MPEQKKSPEEAVKLLRKCASASTFYECAGCPYFSHNCDDLLLDAAAAIEALMGRKDGNE